MKNLFIVLFSITSLVAKIDVISDKKSNIEQSTKEDIAKVYLKKNNKLNGIKVTPIDVKEDYNQFCIKVLNKSPQKTHAYWMKQIFLGNKRPPKRVNRDKLKDELKNQKNSIGYSSIESIDGKLIYRSEE
jgi:dTDP-4-amino-4,6-dideoxygalactose transaminase